VGPAVQQAKNTIPSAPIPVRRLQRDELDAAPDRSLYRLGHSTLLLKLRGHWWITDPVFAQRASPVQWMGPRRFHAPPIALRSGCDHCRPPWWTRCTLRHEFVGKPQNLTRSFR